LLPFFFERHGLIGFFPRWEVGQAATMFLGDKKMLAKLNAQRPKDCPESVFPVMKVMKGKFLQTTKHVRPFEQGSLKSI